LGCGGGAGRELDCGGSGDGEYETICRNKKIGRPMGPFKS